MALSPVLHAPDQNLLRWIQVEADHIADFIDEERIGGKLAHLGVMGSEAEGPPDSMEGIVRESAAFRPRACTLVRRFALQCADDDVAHLRTVERTPGATCSPLPSQRLPLPQWEWRSYPQHLGARSAHAAPAPGCACAGSERRHSFPLLMRQHQCGLRPFKIDHA